MLFFLKLVSKFFFLTVFFLASIVDGENKSSEIKIFFAKDIITLNLNEDSVEAVATRGSTIINIGSKEKLISIYPGATLISDYKNATLVPGFIEHHIHPFLAAVTMNSEILAIEDWHLPTKTSMGVRDRLNYLLNLSQIENLSLIHI